MSIEKALAFLKKEIGECAVRPLCEFPDIQVSVIDSQSIILNLILGRGGWPKGHIVEIFGNENSGKTTLCYHAIASEQKRGGTCAMVDAEHRVDPKYAGDIGVDTSKLLFYQPTSGEEAMELINKMAESNEIDLIVVDSVDAIRPRQEEENPIGKANIGKHASLINQGIRKLSTRKGKCCIIFTNQIRENPGQMFGNPEYTPGGRALKFYSSIRLELRKGQQIENADEKKIASTVKISCKKNSVAPPFREGEIVMAYGEGIDQVKDVFDAGLLAGVIIKKGSYYSIKDEEKEFKVGQGEAFTIKWLKEKDRVKKIRNIILKSNYYLTETGKVKSSQPVPIREAEEIPGDGEEDDEGEAHGLVSVL